MRHVSSSDDVAAVKDETSERPIPTAWRKSLRAIVAAFVAGDYRLEGGVAGVEPVSSDTATRIQQNVRDYDATLVALPDETWSSSVCIWTGSRWDALVDLWTLEEVRSDLVLHAKVTENASGYSIVVYLVYVP